MFLIGMNFTTSTPSNCEFTASYSEAKCLWNNLLTFFFSEILVLQRDEYSCRLSVFTGITWIKLKRKTTQSV